MSQGNLGVAKIEEHKSVPEKPEMDEQKLSQLHYELIHGLIETGICPTNANLAQTLGASETALEEQLCSLADIHGVVLHSHSCRPWIIHPFSLTPTLNWIEGPKKSWWAPCIWCALGVATLVGGETRLHTRFGAEGEPLIIALRNGEPIFTQEVRVHFAIPPANAWDNVHEHCSMVLPFRSDDEVAAWCDRHGLPRGEIVSLRQVTQLATSWYGTHADPTWHKWTVAEAQELFSRAGLCSEFWELKKTEGKF
jgi:hypothetical protein